MSRISRYQESISRFIKTKSCYSDIVKHKNIETILSFNDHETSIILLTILNGQYKKKNLKSHHGYYMASGVDLMMTIALVCDNIEYFEKKYGKMEIKNLINQGPIFVSECLSQNIEILENILEKEKILKFQRKIHSYVNKKLLDIVNYEIIETNGRVHRTDIIKYKFSNKNIINEKYRKLKLIDKDILIGYVERTYGSVCQCAFVLGWLLGMGDEKMINNFERLGSHLGIIIKLANDFKNLERDIENSGEFTLNLIANFGIHESFRLFDESKLKLLEGCMTLDVYNITIKEVIDHIEKKFDDKLKNTDLELASKYSSFSSE